MKKIKILSLFDGMSGGQIAFSKLMNGRPYDWYSSEIDKRSIAITQYNFPNTIQLGDVRNIDKKMIKRLLADGDFDAVIAGSPCKNVSQSGNRKGMITKCGIEIVSVEQYRKLKKEGKEFEGQSYLFWEYIDKLELIKPKNSFLENVTMGGQMQKWEKIMSKAIGREPIRVNSSLVTAQNRDRLYWPSFDVTIPEDENIMIYDVIPDAMCAYGESGRQLNGSSKYTQVGANRKDGKANCLTTNSKRRWITMYDGSRRPLTIEECEILQGVPVGYTDVPGVSLTARFEALGNGWTVPLIEHFFSHIPELNMVEEYSR
jgi:DNA (cytosine-5)-methyltransferase 3A